MQQYSRLIKSRRQTRKKIWRLASLEQIYNKTNQRNCEEMLGKN